MGVVEVEVRGVERRAAWFMLLFAFSKREAGARIRCDFYIHPDPRLRIQNRG
jgi:hypothetical protein